MRLLSLDLVSFYRIINNISSDAMNQNAVPAVQSSSPPSSDYPPPLPSQSEVAPNIDSKMSEPSHYESQPPSVSQPDTLPLVPATNGVATTTDPSPTSEASNVASAPHAQSLETEAQPPGTLEDREQVVEEQTREGDHEQTKEATLSENPQDPGHSTSIGNAESMQPQPAISQPTGDSAVGSDDLSPPDSGPQAVPPVEDVKPESSSPDQEMTDAPSAPKIAREREEDDDAGEPSAKRTKTEVEGASDRVESQPSPVVPTTETDPTSVAEATAETTTMPAPATDPSTAAVQPRVQHTSEAASSEEWGPLKETQTKQLKQNLQNLKKGRHAAHFSKPVDPVLLNLPTYFDVIKQPMDLGTMDKKIRENRYTSVADYINDFNLIVDNTMTFNGPNHVVSMAGQSLRAQFYAGLKRIPKAGEIAPPPEPKKRRSSLGPMPQRDSKARESRGPPPAPPTPTATNQAFALSQDGIPLTRRVSAGNDGRPKREIHRPAPRDLPYLSAKPKKKKYQVELRFCEHVLGELKKGRYSHLMAPFIRPVDPVALNIPTYYKTIKKPMDFGTITDKLGNGQYENAKEFDTDVRLVFENCYKFNGPTHPLSGLAKNLEGHYKEEMKQKPNWIAQNAPDSAPQSPEAESASEAEDEEDEEEEEPNQDRDEQIKNIHQQIAELSRKAMALSNNPTAVKKAVKDKKKGSKPAKNSGGKEKRKSLPGPSRPEKKVSKPKPKAPKVLTVKEKEEISERIGELGGSETAKAAELIKAGLRKNGRHDLADKPDEELEFDIDSIPNDVLYQLLMLVRHNDPAQDYRPMSSVNQNKGAGSSGKSKKHKPMSKHEQEAAVRRINSQLSNFEASGGYGATSSCKTHDSLPLAIANDSPAPDPNAAEGSDDDDDSGSESEEE